MPSGLGDPRKFTVGSRQGRVSPHEGYRRGGAKLRVGNGRVRDNTEGRAERAGPGLGDRWRKQGRRITERALVADRVTETGAVDYTCRRIGTGRGVTERRVAGTTESKRLGLGVRFPA